MPESTLTDALLVTVCDNLSTAQLGDVLDTFGRREQFLPPEIQMATPARKLVGWAMPLLEIAATPDDESFGLMFEALDNLGVDEVYLAAAGAPPFALWGELMNTRALANGAAGVVLDGYMRDTSEIKAMSLPVFARGSYAQDQRGRGRVVAYRVPVRVGNVVVRPGDLVVADEDGVLCVPSDVVVECVDKAIEKRRVEERIAREIQNGLSTSDAFSKYGVM